MLEPNTQQLAVGVSDEQEPVISPEIQSAFQQGLAMEPDAPSEPVEPTTATQQQPPSPASPFENEAIRRAFMQGLQPEAAQPEETRRSQRQLQPAEQFQQDHQFDYRSALERSQMPFHHMLGERFMRGLRSTAGDIAVAAKAIGIPGAHRLVQDDGSFIWSGESPIEPHWQPGEEITPDDRLQHALNVQRYRELQRAKDPIETGEFARDILLKTAEMAGPMLVSIGLGIGTKSAGTMAFWGAQGYGQTYGRLIQDGVDEDIARIAGLGPSVVYGLLAKMQASRMFPGATQRAVASMTDKSVNASQKLMAVLQQYGMNVGSQIGIEMAQEGMMVTGEEIGRGLAQRRDPTLELHRHSISESLQRMGMAGLHAAGPMAIMSAPGASITAARVMRDHRMQRDAQDIQRRAGIKHSKDVRDLSHETDFSPQLREHLQRDETKQQIADQGFTTFEFGGRQTGIVPTADIDADGAPHTVAIQLRGDDGAEYGVDVVNVHTGQVMPVYRDGQLVREPEFARYFNLHDALDGEQTRVELHNRAAEESARRSSQERMRIREDPQRQQESPLTPGEHMAQTRAVHARMTGRDLDPGLPVAFRQPEPRITAPDPHVVIEEGVDAREALRQRWFQTDREGRDESQLELERDTAEQLQQRLDRQVEAERSAEVVDSPASPAERVEGRFRAVDRVEQMRLERNDLLDSYRRLARPDRRGVGIQRGELSWEDLGNPPVPRGAIVKKPTKRLPNPIPWDDYLRRAHDDGLIDADQAQRPETVGWLLRASESGEVQPVLERVARRDVIEQLTQQGWRQIDIPVEVRRFQRDFDWATGRNIVRGVTVEDARRIQAEREAEAARADVAPEVTRPAVSDALDINTLRAELEGMRERVTGEVTPEQFVSQLQEQLHPIRTRPGHPEATSEGLLVRQAVDSLIFEIETGRIDSGRLSQLLRQDPGLVQQLIQHAVDHSIEQQSQSQATLREGLRRGWEAQETREPAAVEPAPERRALGRGLGEMTGVTGDFMPSDAQRTPRQAAPETIPPAERQPADFPPVTRLVPRSAEARRAIVQALPQDQAANIETIAQQSGLDPATIQDQINTLLGDGLIQDDGAGNFTATRHGQRWLGNIEAYMAARQLAQRPNPDTGVVEMDTEVLQADMGWEADAIMMLAEALRDAPNEMPVRSDNIVPMRREITAPQIVDQVDAVRQIRESLRRGEEVSRDIAEQYPDLVRDETRRRVRLEQNRELDSILANVLPEQTKPTVKRTAKQIRELSDSIAQDYRNLFEGNVVPDKARLTGLETEVTDTFAELFAHRNPRSLPMWVRDAKKTAESQLAAIESELRRRAAREASKKDPFSVRLKAAQNHPVLRVAREIGASLDTDGDSAIMTMPNGIRLRVESRGDMDIVNAQDARAFAESVAEHYGGQEVTGPDGQRFQVPRNAQDILANPEMLDAFEPDGVFRAMDRMDPSNTYGLDGIIFVHDSADPTAINHELAHAAIRTVLNPQEYDALIHQYRSEEGAVRAVLNMRAQPQGVIATIWSRLRQLADWMRGKVYAPHVVHQIATDQIWTRRAPWLRAEAGTAFSAKQRVNRVDQIFQERLAEQIRRREAGEPPLPPPTDLAYHHAPGTEGRAFEEAVDIERAERGQPERRSDHVRNQRAEQMRQEMGEQGVLENVMDTASRDGQLSDVETVAAIHSIIHEFADAGIDDTGSVSRSVAEHYNAYRHTRGETARALRAGKGFGREASPEQRTMWGIIEALYQPRPQEQRRMGIMRKRAAKLRRQGQNRQAQRIENQLETMTNRIADGASRIIGILRQRGYDLSPEGWHRIMQDRRALGEVKRIISTERADVLDKIIEFQLDMLLSAPPTHMVNFSTTMAMTAWETGPQRVVEAALNLIHQNPDAAHFGEFRHMYRGLTTGFIEGLRNAREAYRTEMPIIGERTHIDAPGDMQRGPAIGGVLGRVLRMPSLRLMLATDQFTKTLSAHMQAGAMAYRIAKGEGLRGQALSDRIQQLVHDHQSPAWYSGLDFAEYTAFQNDLGPIGQQIMAAREAFPVSRLQIPFMRTPVNLLKVGLRKSPLGSFALAYRFMADPGSFRDGTLITQTAEQIIAWTATMALYEALGFGRDDEDPPLITGSTPWRATSAGERELAYRYAPPQSIRTPNGYVSYQRFDPFATALTMVIDAFDGMRRVAAGESVEDAAQRATQTMGSLVHDKTFLQGVQALLDVIETGDATRFATQLAGTFSPNMLKQFLRAQDPSIPETRIADITQRLHEQMLPRQAGLQPRVDLFGRDVEAGGTMLSRAISPFRVYPTGHRSETEQRIDRALYRWNQQNPDNQVTPGPIGHVFTVAGQQHEYTQEEYHELAETAGRLTLEMLRGFNVDTRQPKRHEIEMIERTIQSARNIARSIVQPRALQRVVQEQGAQQVFAPQ